MTGQQTDFLNEFWMTVDKPERKPAEPTSSKLRFYAILTTEAHLDRRTIKEWSTHIVCTFPTRTIRGAAAVRAREAGRRLQPVIRKDLTARQVRNANHFLSSDEFKNNIQRLIERIE